MGIISLLILLHSLSGWPYSYEPTQHVNAEITVAAAVAAAAACRANALLLDINSVPLRSSLASLAERIFLTESFVPVSSPWPHEASFLLCHDSLIAFSS